MEKIDIAGLKIDPLTKDELLDAVLERVQTGTKTFITTPYSEFLFAAMRDPAVLEMLNKADLTVADGVGIIWAAKYLSLPLTAKSYNGKIFQALWQVKYSLAAILFYPSWVKSVIPEKIPGSELIWDLARLAAFNAQSVYLLGGFGETPAAAAKALVIRNPQLKIAGISNKDPNDPSVIADIQKANPDFLFVAYGPLKQEQWIVEHMNELPAKLYIGLGGTFDYIAGTRSQPPSWIRSVGLEWLYRLITQPQRIKRIFNATFGLIKSLVRYKVFTSYPMRKNVACVVINSQNLILACQRNPKTAEMIGSVFQGKFSNYWQLPQGGIDGKENISEAAKRELFEETGIQSVEIIKLSEHNYSYFWNNSLRKLKKNARQAPGQRQSIVYFKFTGDEKEIKIDNSEFIAYKWTGIQDLQKTLHEERKGLTNIILEDLKDLA